MFKRTDIKPVESKVFLAFPTMHDEEIKYVQESYDTNWLGKVDKNINEIEKVATERAEAKYGVALSCCTAVLRLCWKLAGVSFYGKFDIFHGVLVSKRVFCSDMTFDPRCYEAY